MQYDRREVEFHKESKRAEIGVGHMELWAIFLVIVAMLLSLVR